MFFFLLLGVLRNVTLNEFYRQKEISAFRFPFGSHRVNRVYTSQYNHKQHNCTYRNKNTIHSVNIKEFFMRGFITLLYITLFGAFHFDGRQNE